MEKYVKSPLNYTGNKHRILEQILNKIPLEPSTLPSFTKMISYGFSIKRRSGLQRRRSIGTFVGSAD